MKGVGTLKINKKETTTEKKPLRSSRHAEMDVNEESGPKMKKKVLGHVATLTNALHGKDPYCASHKL
jgi:hypothetical protein